MNAVAEGAFCVVKMMSYRGTNWVTTL